MKVKSDNCKHSYKEICPLCLDFGVVAFIPNKEKNKIEKIELKGGLKE